LITIFQILNPKWHLLLQKWHQNSIEMLQISVVVIIVCSACAAVSSTWYGTKQQTISNAILSTTKNLADTIPLAPYFTQTRL
jgi:hypothetical protein